MKSIKFLIDDIKTDIKLKEIEKLLRSEDPKIYSTKEFQKLLNVYTSFKFIDDLMDEYENYKRSVKGGKK